MAMFQRGCVILLVMLASACGSGGSTTTSPTPTTPPTPTTFSLRGTVTDSTDGNGLFGATVSIADGSNAGRSATTDTSGNYSFIGLQQAEFTVNVAARNYVSQSSGVTLTSNQTLSVQLERISYAGNWKGTTSQSQAVSFMVTFSSSSNGNALGSFTITVAGKSCSQTIFSYPFFPYGAPITNGNFTNQDGGFAGTFRSATTASGTFNMTTSSCGTASGTWTATKQ